MTTKIQYPDDAACEQMMREYGTPEHIISHCRAVKDVAVTVANALNEHGFQLDVDLVRFAAGIHDICRLDRDHQITGALYLRQKGYEEAADIVGVHMTYPRFNIIAESDETDMVCLGDRTVIESLYVGIDERMQYITDKVLRESGARKEFALKRIEKGKNQLKTYVSGVENIIGMSLDELVNTRCEYAGRDAE